MTGNGRSASTEPDLFRHVLGHVPTAVTVTTALTPEGPKGLVIGSFVSISLDPPLVGVFADRESTSWPSIAATGAFAVNVLAADQTDLCARFARRGGDKFDGLDWQRSPCGNPLLPDVTAWIDCRIDTVHAIGDHDLAVGRVHHLFAATSPPLVFHRGALRVLDSVA